MKENEWMKGEMEECKRNNRLKGQKERTHEERKGKKEECKRNDRIK